MRGGKKGLYSMDRSTRKLTLLGSVALAGVVLIGWGFKSIFGHAKQSPQAMNAYGNRYPLQGQPGGQMPDMTKLASMAGMAGMGGGNPALMVKLMRDRVDPRAMNFITQTKIKLISEDSRSVHYLLTFPDGATSDETVAITPDRHYTPTAAELQRPRHSGPQVFQPKLTSKKIGDKEIQLTLRYYVLQESLPADLQQKIRQTRAGAKGADFFTLVPTAWAQEGAGAGGGSNGQTSVAWNIAELVKSMDVKSLEKLELEKSAKVVDNILTLKDLIKSYGEIQGWLGEVAELEDCAKNPTNPLTAKAAQGQDYQQVMDGLNEASWDIQMTAFPKVANITAGAITQFLPFGTGVMITPITDANDAAVEQYAQQRINDAKNMVLPCDKEQKMEAFGFRPMKGTFEYKYNESHKDCSHTEGIIGCSFNTTVREEKGTFIIDPNATEAEAAAANRGTGFAKEDGGFENPKCHGETHTSMSGAVKVSVEAGGTPESGLLRLIAGSGDWQGTLDSSQTCGAEPPVHRTWDNAGAPGVDCKFSHVDMINGGHYSTFSSAADNGHGTCVIDLERK
jgi:hypothetical protein